MNVNHSTLVSTFYSLASFLIVLIHLRLFQCLRWLFNGMHCISVAKYHACWIVGYWCCVSL